MNVGPSDTPVVILGRGKMLRVTRRIPGSPRNWGIHTSPGRVRLAGRRGGPAGFAASVYSASDGLQVTTVDAIAAGGQASTTSRIENYLGFPAGISGAEVRPNVPSLRRTDSVPGWSRRRG